MTNLKTATGLLKKLSALVLGAVLLFVGFMFSVVLLAVVAIVGVCAVGYFWWKTRVLRRVIRERSSDGGTEAQVIEGEAIVVEVSRVDVQQALLRQPLSGTRENDTA